MYKRFTRHIFTNAIILKKTRAMKLQGKQYERNKQMLEQTYDYNRNWARVSYIGDVQQQNQKEFKLLSYNILAQDLLVEHFSLYQYVQPDLLTWNNRLNNLRQEITKLNPDILCLQEMQYDHLQEFVAAIKGNKRLEYIFKKKTGTRTDGCAIIYDSDKFQIKAEQLVEYYTDYLPTLNRENIAILAKFKIKGEPDKSLIIATTHLLYNPKRSDVRNAQVKVLLAALRNFSTDPKVDQRKDDCGKQPRVPIILTGDFNFEADSETFDLLQANQSVEDNPMTTEPLQMSALQFGQYTASTFQDRWITVDYILHSVAAQGTQIHIWSLYNLPELDVLTRLGCIPNTYLGSDHYSLAITFSVI